MSYAHVDLEVVVFLVSFIPLALTVFWLSFSRCSLTPEGEGFDGDIKFSAECYKFSCSLHNV